MSLPSQYFFHALQNEMKLVEQFVELSNSLIPGAVGGTSLVTFSVL